MDGEEGKERMKVFLDVKPASEKDCRRGGRSVKELEWVSNPAAAEGVVADRLASLDLEKKALYLGPLSQLTKACNDGKWSGQWSAGHRWRFEASVRAVRESLQAGQLGAPCLLRIHCWTAMPESASASVASSQSDRREEDLAAQLDLALWLFDRWPETVYATGPRKNAESDLLVHLGFPDGGMAVIDFARLPPGGDYYSLHLIGENGAAYADDHRNVSLLYGGGVPQALPVDGNPDAISAMLGAFAGDPHCGAMASAEETRSALRLAAAVFQSRKNSAPFQWNHSAIPAQASAETNALAKEGK